ncbi:glycosyltransferase family 25 protein [Xanthobacter autotrophicus]|uniref:glycosyltransferase family 25 protein n=1 Tax=Xanthobacter autotrophicus TaxID=280 RepID=UPI0024A77778|nr:glycosyltransferase family 25 protein [Xanthobacter autotrophicus]MDI4658614.1 glycosyltransferase family 25 protein [Xanthobacter autotrophicus]
MLILLINLARRPDRLAFMRSQLDALGLAFERIEAVDGQALDWRAGTGCITAGERACALSHRTAWQRFLASDEQLCLVLEDDALIAPEAKLLLESPRAFPPDADILRLEATPQYSTLGRGRRCGPAGIRAHRLHSKQHGTAAYMITRAFAERALRDLVDFAESIDVVLFEPASTGYYQNVTYQLRPGVCLQAEFYEPGRIAGLAMSDLETERAPRPLAPKPARSAKVRRSIPEKCLREMARWGRRFRVLAKFHSERIIVGRVWRDVPFIGTVLPVAVAALAASPETSRPNVPTSRDVPADIETRPPTGSDQTQWVGEPQWRAQDRSALSIRS